MTFRAQHGGLQARAWYEGKRISATGPTKEIAAQRIYDLMDGDGPRGQNQGGVIARLVDYRDGGWQWKVYTSTKTLAEGKSETYEEAIDAANDFTVRPGNPNW